MMKRISVLLVLMVMAAAAYAVRPLQILKALDGTYRKADHAIETIVTGQAVKPYGLTRYHSLSVTDSAAIADLRRLMKADMSSAVNQEVGMLNGEINYGFFEFSLTDDKKNRFVFFFSDSTKAIVIYMEGNTSIDKIKSIIKK